MWGKFCPDWLVWTASITLRQRLMSKCPWQQRQTLTKLLLPWIQSLNAASATQTVWQFRWEVVSGDVNEDASRLLQIYLLSYGLTDANAVYNLHSRSPPCLHTATSSSHTLGPNNSSSAHSLKDTRHTLKTKCACVCGWGDVGVCVFFFFLCAVASTTDGIFYIFQNTSVTLLSLEFSTFHQQSVVRQSENWQECFPGVYEADIVLLDLFLRTDWVKCKYVFTFPAFSSWV